MRIVEVEGFQTFVKDLTLLAYKNHIVIGQDSILHRTTLSNMIPKYYENKKEKFTLITRKLSSFSLYMDLWTQKTTGTKFLAVFIAYIDENHNFKTRNLSTQSIDVASKVEIKREVTLILNEFELKQKGISCVVTDMGSNIVNLFPECLSLVCFAHRLNTVISSVFNEPGILIAKLLRCCSKISQMSKFSSFKLAVGVKLPSLCLTRWNARYCLLSEVMKNFNSIKQYLESQNHFNMVRDLNKNLISKLIDFLKPFYIATKDVEKLQYTLHILLPLQHTLRNHIIKNKEDSDISISRLATKTQEVFDNKITAYEDAYTKLLTASFLHPEFSQLSWIPVIRRNLFIEEIRDNINLDGIFEDDDKHTDDYEDIVEEFATNRKKSVRGKTKQMKIGKVIGNKAREETTDFGSIRTPRAEKGELCEVDEYLNLCRAIPEEIFRDSLRFWATYKTTLPRLYKMFIQNASVMGSTSLVEGHFSRLGYYINSRKSNLNKEKLRAYAFLNDIGDQK